MRKIFKLFVLFYCGCSSAATLTYQEISADTFLFILNNDVPLEIGQAQSAIYSGAVQICNGRNPSLGKYKFSSSEPISNDTEDSVFSFQQEVECTDEAAIAATPKKLDLSSDQEAAIKSIAKKKTEQYLSAKDSGEFAKAYDMLGPSMKNITEFPAWKMRESVYFVEKLGKLESRDIWRVTLYNNPPNAPNPGLYIAVDYENSYTKAPVHCGYIMWFLPTAQSGEYAVIREEYGTITKAMMEEIPQENLQNIRKQIGCRSL